MQVSNAQLKRKIDTRGVYHHATTAAFLLALFSGNQFHLRKLIRRRLTSLRRAAAGAWRGGAGLEDALDAAGTGVFAESMARRPRTDLATMA